MHHKHCTGQEKVYTFSSVSRWAPMLRVTDQIRNLVTSSPSSSELWCWIMAGKAFFFLLMLDLLISMNFWAIYEEIHENFPQSSCEWDRWPDRQRDGQPTQIMPPNMRTPGIKGFKYSPNNFLKQMGTIVCCKCYSNIFHVSGICGLWYICMYGRVHCLDVSLLHLKLSHNNDLNKNLSLKRDHLQQAISCISYCTYVGKWSHGKLDFYQPKITLHSPN